MTSPFTTQGLVVEALYQPQSCGARDADDVFPFLVALEHLDRKPLNTSADAAVLIYLPHTQKILYLI
jgi:hypothetical protein